MTDWGDRLLALVRREGVAPETGVTHVTTRNRNPGYVSEKPLVTPVTPVTPSKTAFSNRGKNHGVTGGVTRPTETDERVALIEIGAGVPLEWAKSFARLEQTAPRLGLSEPIWRTIIDDAGRFLDVWTDAAIHAGWLPDDVFEIQILPDTAPIRVGLAQLIRGGQVLQIAGPKVTIRSGSGICSIYQRQMYGLNCTWGFEIFIFPSASEGDRRAGAHGENGGSK
jgi:hypothetical protein